MRRLFVFLFIFSVIFNVSCKKKNKIPEPGIVLKKWANAVKELNYGVYRKFEAYPKSNPVFREMYKSEYFNDISVTGIEDVDYEKVRKDYKDDSYISCSVSFEGTVVKRNSDKAYQSIRGDVLFIRFTEGDRSKDGWLMSNRSVIRINK